MKIKFPKDNEIVFFQDMSFWVGVPSDIEFDIEIEKGGTAWLTGPGYGDKDNYGNGRIAVRFGMMGGLLDSLKGKLGEVAYNNIKTDIKYKMIKAILKG
jgi:hypothetical protein